MRKAITVLELTIGAALLIGFVAYAAHGLFMPPEAPILASR